MTNREQAILDDDLHAFQQLVSQPDLVEEQNDEGRTALHLAARAGGIKIVEYLLQLGANPSAQDLAHWTPLHIAAEKNHEHIVRLLIKSGSDLNAIGPQYTTPMDLALSHRRIEIVELLLEAGADPNIGDEQRWTPLQYAARDGNARLIDALLRIQRTDLEPQDADGITPLHLACHNGHFAIVEQLLQAGVYPDIDTLDGELPVDFARRKNHALIVQLLEQQHEQDEAQQSLLRSAETDDSIQVGQLLTQGTDIHTRNSLGLTPLHLTAQHNAMQTAQLLISHGARVNAASLDNLKPLHVAVSNGNLEVATMLIAAGAGVNCCTTHGLSPLHCATILNNFACIQLLVEHGADVNMRNSMGLTPLGLVRDPASDIAEYLIAHGASVSPSATVGDLLRNLRHH